MKIIDVPFVDHNNITENENGELVLKISDQSLNHVGSIHAAAQFALAESASGHYLLVNFSELEGQAVPLLREASIKYIKQATTTISAQASTAEGSLEKFMQTFSKKGRGMLEVSVNVKDSEGDTTCSGIFRWFIQRIED